MQGILFGIAAAEALGALLGLGALGLALWHHSDWPPIYIYSACLFHLVVLTGAWRLMQMQSWGRAVSAVTLIAQVKTWGATTFLAGPLLSLVWSRGILRASVGAGGYVGVVPPPAGATGRSPALAWTYTFYEGTGDLFSSSTVNLFALIALGAIIFSVWLDRRRMRQVSEEAAELGKAEAARHRLRTPTRIG